MLCESKELPVVEFNDSSARKALFGDGNGKMKKPVAQAALVSKYPEHGGKTSDELDAIVLAMGWNILNTCQTDVNT
jgi:Holliday junction resolvasome RuvABC endonuclease subunit